MISEERLKELIEQEKDVWVNGQNDISIGCVHLNKKYQPELYRNGLSNYILYIYTNDKFEYKEEIFDSQLYETKEEAEFVSKYYCSKTIKFEPPTFEEFMVFGFWKSAASEIEYYEECFEGDGNDYFVVFISTVIGQVRKKEFYVEDYKDQQQAYYQAVEYAKKLFLGEGRRNKKNT